MLQILKPENKIERQQAIKDVIDSSTETIKYGDDDNAPNKLIEDVDNSPTGEGSIQTIQRFIKGSGFPVTILRVSGPKREPVKQSVLL